MKLTGLAFDQGGVLALGYEAGRLALDWFGRVHPERKADRSIVTEADRAVELLVRERLAVLTPDWPVLGEEAGLGGGGRPEAPTWVLDPVDGTSAFASGLPIWAVSLGLVQNGRAVWGLVFSPRLGEMVHTGLDGRVYRNGQPFDPEPAAALDNESVLYAPSDIHRFYRIDFEGKVRSLGSSAFHGLLTARSCTAGVLEGRVYHWDVAAILAINYAWGMRVGTLDGREVSLKLGRDGNRLPEPLLFSRPEVFEELAGRIIYMKNK